MTKEEAVNLVWDYMHMDHELRKADVILALGGSDIRVATYASELYRRGLAPLVIASGDARNHVSAMLKDKFSGRTEAEVFGDELEKNGVPKSAILLETKANNTEENFAFTRELLNQKGLNVSSAIVVTKPYMERRAYATSKKAWSELEIVVTSPPLSFEECVHGHALHGETGIINGMVGDLQRINEYPKLGFQIEQEIPEKVWEAFEHLVSLGYTKRLLQK